MRTRLSILSWPKPKGGPHYAICHFCDTIHVAEPIPEGTSARCTCCGATLFQNRPASLVRVTAFSLTALLLMVFVHTAPFIYMDAASIRTALTLPSAAWTLAHEGAPIVGIGVALFTIVAPLVLAGGLVYVCGPLMFGRKAPGAIFVTAWMSRTEPWNMIEVFLLGVLVSLLKLGHLAELHFGLGFWAFTALMFCMAAAVAAIDKRELWDRLEVAGSK
ncbi:paraquat-inducible protein A [Luteolibacter algae]|uniref:Paraquat-inducible protein A n=1 Tax=Luteolibacter algae TaxID=454151 RepID=A0ABW5DAT2_9BACT